MQTVTCPNCRGQLANDPALAGRQVQCPLCGAGLVMPAAFRAPSKHYLKEAAKLGVVVSPEMDYDAVAAAVNRAREDAELSPADRETRPAWERFIGDGHGEFLTVFIRGKQTVADVLQLASVDVDDKGRLCLEAVAPKIERDKDVGDSLDWDKPFDLLAAKVLYCERMPADFDFWQLDVYRRAVEHGLKVAQQLSSAPPVRFVPTTVAPVRPPPGPGIRRLEVGRGSAGCLGALLSLLIGLALGMLFSFPT